jgi:hypothetical protein
MDEKKFYSSLFGEKIKNLDLSSLLNSSLIREPLSKNFYYVDDEEFPYFPPFYKDGKLNHFYPTDALLTFLMCEYDLKKIKILEENFYAILTRQDEIIYHHTKPDKLIIRLTKREEPIDFEINIFSTKVLYKTRGMKRARVLELYEINDIFSYWLVEYLKRVLRANHKRYIL